MKTMMFLLSLLLCPKGAPAPASAPALAPVPREMQEPCQPVNLSTGFTGYSHFWPFLDIIGHYWAIIGHY